MYCVIRSRDWKHGLEEWLRNDYCAAFVTRQRPSTLKRWVVGTHADLIPEDRK